MYRINIKGQTFSYRRVGTSVQDSVNTEEVQFAFDPTWDGITRFACFKNPNVADEQHPEIHIALDYTNTVEIPWEVYQVPGPLYVGALGMRGTDVVKPTTWVQLSDVKEGVDPCFEGKEFTPSLKQQVVAIAQESTDIANDAKLIANQALKEAGETSVWAEKAEGFANSAQKSSESAGQHAENAKKSETNAKSSEISADASETGAKQAFSDLLNMMGTDIPTLIDGKVPVEQLPATALVDIFEVSSEQELTGLVAQKGDLGELIEIINGKRTITKTWQLLTNDPTSLDNWVIWGSSYAVQAGNATTADNAENANKINGHRIVQIEKAEWEGAVKDPDTYYLVYDKGAEV